MVRTKVFLSVTGFLPHYMSDHTLELMKKSATKHVRLMATVELLTRAGVINWQHQPLASPNRCSEQTPPGHDGDFMLFGEDFRVPKWLRRKQWRLYRSYSDSEVNKSTYF